MAYNSEWRNIWRERIEEKWGRAGEMGAGKLIHFALGSDRSIWMKDRGRIVAEEKNGTNMVLFQKDNK